MRGVEEADGGIGDDSGGKARERVGGKRGTGKAGGGGPGGREGERGSGGVREEKKGRESRKSMGPQDDARGLLPKMTWDTLEQVTGGVTTDFTLFIVVIILLPFLPLIKSKPSIVISQLHSGKYSENVIRSENAQMYRKHT